MEKVTFRRVRQELIKLKNELPDNRVVECLYTGAGGVTDRCIAGEVYYRVLGKELGEHSATVAELYRDVGELDEFSRPAVKLLEAAQIAQDGDVLDYLDGKAVRKSPLTNDGMPQTRRWSEAVNWALEHYPEISYV